MSSITSLTSVSNNLYIDTADECPICLEPFEGALKLIACGHKFHENCMNSWTSIHNNCPKCKFILGPEPQQQEPVEDILLTAADFELVLEKSVEEGNEEQVRRILDSEGFTQISAASLGEALESAALYGFSNIVKMILLCNRFAEIPAPFLGKALTAGVWETERRYVKISRLVIGSGRFHEIPVKYLATARRVSSSCGSPLVARKLQSAISTRFWLKTRLYIYEHTHRTSDLIF